ncbi:carbon-nitrogen hydrolase family protein [bacterium]|nr:carbon-nitrogen hydrolase family protein [bacterium]
MAGILSIQINSLMGDKERNLEKIEKQLEQNCDKKLDLVLIPEFFSTNIDYEKAPEDENGGEVLARICELARQYGTNIVAGSIVRKVGEKFYNTSFAVNRAGEVLTKYDKIHLFNYMGGNEGNFTSAGSEIVTVDFDFGRVGLAVCFDVRYPLLFNQLIKRGVDLITLPTAWLVPSQLYEDDALVKGAKDMWQSMLKTRAYDNMVYFVVSNQCGRVNNGLRAIGNSMIISPSAEIQAKIDEEEGAIYSDIDVDVVRFLRQIYPIAEID